MSAPALAEKYLPLPSIATGKELARLYRTDGTVPSRAQYVADQQACAEAELYSDERLMRKLVEISKRDRDAGQMAGLGAIVICLGQKGWRVVGSEASSSAADSVTGPTVDRRKVRAFADIGLDQLSATLPQKMDEYSDLVAVKRVGDDLIYTVKARPSPDSKDVAMRRYLAEDARTFSVGLRSLLKQLVCEPKPSAFLTTGFAVIYEFVDSKGLIMKERLTLADCR
ncbi:MAG: hypothetical protein LCH93_16665 [Proteobacteria bacterium]|nr:hypothetical protein [Pseudomonadota bacterium]